MYIKKLFKQIIITAENKLITHAHTHARIHTHMHTHTQARMHTQERERACCMSAYACSPTYCVPVHIYIHTHMHVGNNIKMSGVD